MRQINKSVKNFIFSFTIGLITIFSIVFGDEQFITKLIFTYLIIVEAFLLFTALILPNTLILKYFIKNKSINEKADVKRVRYFYFIFFFIFLPEFYIIKFNNSRIGRIYTIIALILFMIGARLIDRKSREDNKNL